MVSLIHLHRREKVTDYFWAFRGPVFAALRRGKRGRERSCPWMIDSVFHHVYCAARRQTSPPCLKIQNHLLRNSKIYVKDKEIKATIAKR
jgi:hypothetical protein